MNLVKFFRESLIEASRFFMPMDVQENISLAPLTTLKVGGPARYFAAARSEDDIAEAFLFADSLDLKVFVLGGGSNVLVSDDGFDGLVLKIELRGILSASSSSVRAMAGEDWDAFVKWCVDGELAGVECLCGIPGTVGGTPVQNVGAYGQEVSETIVSVRCFDRKSRQFVDLSNSECEFEYRKSIFNSTHRERYVVASVTFALEQSGQPKLVYKDLREYFGDKVPTLSDVREAVLKIRRAKSMVIDENDSNSKSAGSFFKNPIIDQARFDEIAARFEKVPHFPAGQGMIKIPAAWLIEQAGFQKGYAIGNAGISTNHTLAIVNRGDATAVELISLKESIQNAVESHFAIKLIPEPVFVGF
ncbi:MAG: UDP-N-acetylmuramate dehydrogenase [Pyrinomonadaceae bacterium]